MSAKPTRDRIDPQKMDTTPKRRPSWIQLTPGESETFDWLKDLMRKKTLHTVCEEAGCPNIGECWGSGTATFLVLGDVCTRACGFCDVRRGRPTEIDWDEADRVAQAVKAMALKHAVITSVTRDDLQDGGATLFAMIITKIREVLPGCSVEVLIPDFKGKSELLKIVMDARPEILNHNLETVQRLFRKVQPQDRLEWSEAVLRNAKKMDDGVLTKSGIMVGLGEEMEEIKETMRLLRSWDVDILTIGQYLQPSRKHLPISRYYTPQEFTELKTYGETLGFKWVESAPLVRSSYHAVDQVQALSKIHRELYSDMKK